MASSTTGDIGAPVAGPMPAAAPSEAAQQVPATDDVAEETQQELFGLLVPKLEDEEDEGDEVEVVELGKRFDGSLKAKRVTCPAKPRK